MASGISKYAVPILIPDPCSFFMPPGTTRSVIEWMAIACPDATILGLDKIVVGAGTDMAMMSPCCCDSTLERLIKNVNFVHDATVKRNLPDFLNPQTEKKNKRRCKYNSAGKWTPPTEVDLAISNCPEQSEKVSRLLLKTLCYWERNVIPYLSKNKAGRGDTYLRAAVMCVTRCCIPVGVAHQAEKIFVNSIDAYICDILKKTIPPADETVLSLEIGEEAVETLSRTIYKHWITAYKNSRIKANENNKKFGSTIAFVRAWKNIAEKYEAYPVHEERDEKMHHVLAAPFTDSRRQQQQQPLYPVNAEATVITGDYLFKLLAELVLSPHIHVEWKMSMCKFIERDARKMLTLLELDIDRAATDITTNIQNDQFTCEYGSEPIKRCFHSHGTKYNPSQILPRASNFWDFCKGGSSPSEIRYCMMFNEPSSNSKLSSGAGLFGFFPPSNCSMEDDEVRVASSCLESLLGMERSGRGTILSTRRWREEGTVICFNFCPLTVSGAILGYGEQKAKGMPAGYWLKTVQRSVTDSVKRKRNAADKGGRTSDLLSDGASLSLTTVAFGCSEMLKALTGVSTFNIAVNYHDSVQSNARGADRLYASQHVVSHSFPALF